MHNYFFFIINRLKINVSPYYVMVIAGIFGATINLVKLNFFPFYILFQIIVCYPFDYFMRPFSCIGIVIDKIDCPYASSDHAYSGRIHASLATRPHSLRLG